MLYNAVEEVISDQIQTAELRVTIHLHMNMYFEASYAAKALGKMMHRKDDFLSPFALFVQTKLMNVPANLHNLNTLKTMSMANHATRPQL